MYDHSWSSRKKSWITNINKTYGHWNMGVFVMITTI
jgi:hypothetical protein